MGASRRRQQEFLLFSSNTTLGWRVSKRVRREVGDAMVTAGSAAPVVDDRGQHIGYQLIEPRPREDKTPSVQSSAVITAREVQANAGVMGQSHTMHLNEEQRLCRMHRLTGKLMVAEDFVERAKEKVKLWPYPAPGRGDRAVRVYPRAPVTR